jgi:uncharacterized protein
VTSAGAAATHEVMWRLQDGGVEHVRVVVGADTVLVDGVQARRGDGEERRLLYLLRCDEAWRVRELHVEAPEDDTSVSLRGDGAGNWTDRSGTALPALQGCVDVDLLAVAFTNTLPVRRLELAVGEAATIAVAFVRVPSMEVVRAEQRYTRLDATTYRYEGLASGFRADLRLDGEGLVVEYPGLARRLWAFGPQ